MKFDPHLESKKRLERFRKNIAKIKHDELMTSPGDVWSARKFFILDYCIDGFARIFNKYFKSWYYVDTHCGAGLIDFGKELYKEKFPGTPLIAAFRSQERHFSKYYFSDINNDAINALEIRLNALKSDIPNCRYDIKRRDFANTVKFLKKGFNDKDGFFIVIDPTGYTEIKWKLMESLLRIDNADIFFNFMTYGIARNRGKVKDNDETFNQFYGNNKWTEYTRGNDLMELYKRQIKEYRKFVFDIPIVGSNNNIIYHIIIATKSSGAKNVVESAKKIAKIEPKIISGAFEVIVGKNTDLDQFL